MVMGRFLMGVPLDAFLVAPDIILCKWGTMSNPSNPESFSLIEEITVPSGWNQYVVNLTGHTPAGQFIAIKHDVGSTYHSLYIDDVSFELIAPNDLAALSVSGETMIPANLGAEVIDCGVGLMGMHSLYELCSNHFFSTLTIMLCVY